ncbi:MAG: DUF4332 domain-containing protein [Longimicrobiales bacterium]
MAKLTAIEGIGVSAERRLKAAGVVNTQGLLDICGSTRGRKGVAGAARMAEAKLLRFVRHADLMRIKGVGGDYAELLEVSGVDSIPDLKGRNAVSLRSRLATTNTTKRKRLVRQLPSEKMVAGWINQAKRLKPKITR